MRLKTKGLSLAEMLVSTLIIAVALTAAIPVLTIREVQKTGIDANVEACIVRESLADPGSDACVAAIAGAKNKSRISISSLSAYVDNPAYSDDALTLAKTICDQGGEEACNILADRCIADANNCDVASKDYDVAYYLNLDNTAENPGKTYLYTRLKEDFENGASNIIAKVDQICATDTEEDWADKNMACNILSVKFYDFNLGKRRDFIEEDAITGTFFEDGSVKLVTSLIYQGTWAKKFSDDDNDPYMDGALAVDNNGNSFLGGRIDQDPTIIKLDSAANILWKKKLYNATFIKALEVDGAGNCYAAIDNYNEGLTIIKLNSEGEEQWQKTINDFTKYKFLCDLFLDDAGNVYLMGPVESSRSYVQYDQMDVKMVIAKFSPNGTILKKWEVYYYRFHTLLEESDWSLFGMTVDNSDDSVYVVGREENLWDGCVVKIDNNGVLQWQRTFQDSTSASNVVLDSEGNVFVPLTGRTDGFSIAKFDSSGNIKWIKKLDGTPADIEDGAANIAIDNEGYIYAVGFQTIETFGNIDAIVMKIRDLGDDAELLWGRHFGGTENDYGFDVDVDNYGNLFIAGTQKSDNTNGYTWPFLIRMKTTQTGNLSNGLVDSTLSVINTVTISVDTSSTVNFTNSSMEVQDVTTDMSNLDPLNFQGIADLEGGSGDITASYVTTSAQNGITEASKVMEVKITQGEPGDSGIKWLVSFDERNTWQYYNSGWSEATTDITTYDWSNSNTSQQIEDNLENYTLPSDSLDFAFRLETSDKNDIPYVDRIFVLYY